MSKESQIKELLTRSIEAVYPSREELEKVLNSGKKLRVYMGIDPTGADIHVGHATNFLVLKRFQDLGHKIILLVGDFTAKIGDPSGHSEARKKLTDEQIKENLKSYKEQISKIIDFNSKDNPPEFRFNSEWLSKIGFGDTIELASRFTVQRVLERDLFQERIKSKKPIYVNEFLYPLAQGYDSVALEADVEIGGTDQTFNMLAGRTLVKEIQKRDKFVVATTLLENPKTGEKLMSKSKKGSYIGLNFSAEDMFGRTMALPDEAITQCFIDCTYLSMKDIDGIKKDLKAGANPRDLKAKLAFEIVKVYYGEDEAKKAEEGFNKVFRDKENPDNAQLLNLEKNSENILDVIVKSKLANSKGEARRLVEQGAVKLQGETIKNWKENTDFKDNQILKVGKKGFAKIKIV